MAARTPLLDEWLAGTRPWIESELERALRSAGESAPRSLVEAMEYAVLGGGKRFRPALVRLTARWLGAGDDACAAPAAAVELIHAYSLVHDDLPCMDDDDFRRGKPSCHKKYGEALAVLAADALQAKAFEVLATGGGARAAEMVLVLARACGDRGMVGGQVLDVALTGHAATFGDVAWMHSMKTGALIAASAELGSIAAGAPPHSRELARQWGEALGRLFQAVDDLLDATADRAALGKTPGKDERQHKPTLVAALGVDGTRKLAGEQAERARVLAMELGGPWSSTGLQMVDFLLDRGS